MCGVFILSVQCVLLPVLCSKAVATRGLKKTRLPERRNEQQLAGLLGVSDYLAAAQCGGAAALCSLHFQL